VITGSASLLPAANLEGTETDNTLFIPQTPSFSACAAGQIIIQVEKQLTPRK